jgi:Uncharacterised nucleotidyltransferase
MAAATPQPWTTVDALVAEAPSLGALRHHGLDLLAARQWRAAGRELDPSLRQAERLATLRLVSVPRLLGLARSAVEEPLILMKGPEVAASYPHPGCRPFGDLDILTPDPDATFASMLRAGFREIGICDAGYHAPPLVWPGIPLKIELHSTPKSVARMPAPPMAELLELTRPSRTGVEGIAAFLPAAHAVLLAVHAWSHGPLERLGQLVDVAAVLSECDRRSADEIARRWGYGRLWMTTTAVIDGLFGSAELPLSVRVWARHLVSGREPRVAERSLARLAAPAWALPPRRVPAGVGDELLRLVQRGAWETRDDQLLRSRRALRHPFRPISEFRASPTTEATT